VSKSTKRANHMEDQQALHDRNPMAAIVDECLTMLAEADKTDDDYLQDLLQTVKAKRAYDAIVREADRDEQLAMSSQEPQDQSSIEALRKRRARIHKAAAKSHGIDKPPSYERCRKQLKQRGIFAAEHDHLHVILEHVMVLLHTPQADLKMGPCTYCIPWTV